MCTFEGCDLKLFADRHTWFNHELECHRLEWCCRFCSHPPLRSETNLVTHMRHKHVQFSSPSQLPILVKASRQPVDRISATACPLCHWDATLRDYNTHISSGETLVVTVEQFRKHLGTHMEQLALFALPRGYKYEGENVDSHEAAAMTHSDSQSRHLSAGGMSWKSVSSRGGTCDKAVPDVDTGIISNVSVHSRDSYPWSQQPLDTSRSVFNPFPRYAPATSQICSTEGHIYMQGGKYMQEGTYDGPVDHDVWIIETNETPTCYPIATIPDPEETKFLGPNARTRHAALLVGNTFILFGGRTKTNGHPDDNLYLLNTSKARPASYRSKIDLTRHKNLVGSCSSFTTFW